MIYIFFFRPRLRQKSPSGIPLEIEPTETEFAIEADTPDDTPDDITDESPNGNSIVTPPNLPNAFAQSNDPNSMAAIDILQSYVIQEHPDLTALPTQLLEQLKILNQSLDASTQDVLPALETDGEQVGANDQKDFYYFTINDLTCVDLRLAGMSADANLQLVKLIGRNEELISWDRGLACLFYLILKFRILEG